MLGNSSMKFAVIGLGLFGKRLARELSEMNHQVLAIDCDEEPATALQDEVDKAVIADVKQEGLLEELITGDIDTVIVTMATDLEANLLSVLHAREVGVDTVIAKSNGPEHTTILRRLGINNIISPEEDVAEQLAEKIGNPRVHEYMQFHDNHGIAEMTVPDFFVGRNLRDLNLRDEYEIQIIGLQKTGENKIDYVPSPSRDFEEGDLVWVTGPEETLQELSRSD